MVAHFPPADLDDDVDVDDEASTERSIAAVSPIPKIVTTAIKEDEYRDEWGESEGQSGNSRTSAAAVDELRFFAHLMALFAVQQ